MRLELRAFGQFEFVIAGRELFEKNIRNTAGVF
jgi:hypothetical protein